MKKYILFLVVLIYLVEFSFAQLSTGGKPFSFDAKNLSQSFQEVSIPSPDSNKITDEDEKNDNNRFAVLIPVDYTTENSGTWETLADGSRIWRIKITVEATLAISMYFSDFYLSDGVKLFLYDEKKEQVKGAFTKKNNRVNGLFASEMIIGESAIVELFVPANISDMMFFTIAEVSYSYRFISEIKGTANVSGSGFCEVNINCSPEGDDWQNEKYGVVRIKVKISGATFWCTGSLVNNAREDKTPYILTADHCAYKFNRYATPEELALWIFDFNYDGIDCESTTASPDNFTMVGAEKIAQGGLQGTTGSDFYLLKLLDSIPENMNVVYNGWSAEDESSDFGVCIHHPKGDIKKISTYTEPLISSSWSGNGFSSHWQVVWAETENGWGVTEGGSSGSPIFDIYGRIIGSLTGGQASCSFTEAPDYYGKFSYHWDSNGTQDSLKLKPWLDPDNTGVTSMSGSVRDTIPVEPEPPLSTNVNIEPNPVFDNLLTFKFENVLSKEAIISISNLSGQTIFTRDVTFSVNKYVLDITPLPKGFYIAIIIFDNLTFEKKFIKQ